MLLIFGGHAVYILYSIAVQFASSSHTINVSMSHLYGNVYRFMNQWVWLSSFSTFSIDFADLKNKHRYVQDLLMFIFVVSFILVDNVGFYAGSGAIIRVSVKLPA